MLKWVNALKMGRSRNDEPRNAELTGPKCRLSLLSSKFRHFMFQLADYSCSRP